MTDADRLDLEQAIEDLREFFRGYQSYLMLEKVETIAAALRGLPRPPQEPSMQKELERKRTHLVARIGGVNEEYAAVPEFQVFDAKPGEKVEVIVLRVEK